MKQNIAAKYADAWFNTLPPENDIPLFNVQPDQTTVILNNGLLTRSAPLSNRINAIKNMVQNSFGQPHCPEGVVYLIYRRDEMQKVQPLYVGKASVTGNQGQLSALFTPAGQIRFAHYLNSKGHIGNMNEALANPGHAYQAWINALFMNPAIPSLNTPVFVNMEVWDANSVSCVFVLDHLSVETEEALRIEIIRQAGYGAALLNVI